MIKSVCSYRAAAFAVSLLSAINVAFADVKPQKSSGLVLSVSKLLVHGKSVVVQFVLSNTTAARVYVRDAQTDKSQSAFLGSGTHIMAPGSVVSIESDCGTVENCLNLPNARNLNSYSYVEPGGSLPFSFEYTAYPEPQETDTISFGVTLIARFAIPDHNPDTSAGDPKPVRFSFAYVPLKD